MAGFWRWVISALAEDTWVLAQPCAGLSNLRMALAGSEGESAMGGQVAPSEGIAGILAQARGMPEGALK